MSLFEIVSKKFSDIPHIFTVGNNDLMMHNSTPNPETEEIKTFVDVIFN